MLVPPEEPDTITDVLLFVASKNAAPTFFVSNEY